MAKDINTKEKNWQTTDKRFVIFLDIMGFKDFVSRNTHEQVYEMMSKLSKSKEILNSVINNNDKANVYNEKLYTTSFSDSLILFSKDDSIKSLEVITTSASFIFSEAIKDSIPMKGAIAHGQISVNKTQQIYFGQPLIDAYLLQEEVNYYGIVCHNSVDKYLSTLKSNEGILEDYIDIKTPIKGGNINHFNINWFDLLNDNDKDKENTLNNFNESINKLKTLTSGAPRKYIDNTIEVFNSIYK